MSRENLESALNDQEFHQQTLQNGGASRDVVTGNVPDRGFMVGGARNLADQPYPEYSHPVDSFEVNDVRAHARAVRDHFGDQVSGVHQGSWVEGDKVVLDASERDETYHSAMTKAKMRGERAVYDVRRGREHHVADLEGRVKN
jgi:hypothetical protein